MGLFSSTVEPLHRFQFKDFPEIYILVARATSGILSRDFLCTEKETKELGNSIFDMARGELLTYTRCFIKTPAGNMEKMLQDPQHYCGDDVITFIDGEEIVVDGESGNAVYKYYFRNQIEEGRMFPLLPVAMIPDGHFLHELFRTVHPYNHTIDQLYIRVRDKERRVRQQERIEGQGSDKFGGVGSREEQWEQIVREFVLLGRREGMFWEFIRSRRTGSVEIVGEDQENHTQVLKHIQTIRQELDKLETQLKE